MRFTLLGTGAAGGIPRWGCPCSACAAAHKDPTKRRRAASAEVRHAGRTFLIDAGIMDLDERYPGGVDGFLVTHFHLDHVQGLFHLRLGIRDPIPVHAPDDGQDCADLLGHPGCLAFTVAKPFVRIDLGDGLGATPVPLAHTRRVLGWVLDDGRTRIAYCTDTRGFPPATQRYFAEHHLDILILDTTHPSPCAEPKGHNDLDLSLDLIARSGADRGALTHISHRLQVVLDAGVNLPDRVVVATDGLVVWDAARDTAYAPAHG